MYFPGYSDSVNADAIAPVITRVIAKGESQENQYLPELKAELGIDDVITDFDDALMRKIKTAIAAVEAYTRLSLQPQTVTVVYAGYDGSPLPFGPVWRDPQPSLVAGYAGATVTFTDNTGGQVAEGLFPTLYGRFPSGTATYKAGYSKVVEDDKDPFPIPEALVGAVLEHAASSWRNGGISGGPSSTYWKSLAGPLRRFE